MGVQLRIAGIINESIVDGPGIRMVIFAQGCTHNCQGCHNPHTHSFEGGELKEVDAIIKDIKKNYLLDGITLSGGDPFEQAEAFSVLAGEAKKLGLNVVTYTGYTYERLIEIAKQREGFAELLKNTDLLIDGPFIQKEKNLLLKFRGSTNQRVIDMNKTRASQKPELAGI
ncbi:MAG: anaerobic ribonucleoside-triphosphate reductase activating protein [Eubacterium sp.]|nr:anaerobic ribonucleoside-triphosphate reductase activating protein [Eubacterium sp.]